MKLEKISSFVDFSFAAIFTVTVLSFLMFTACSDDKSVAGGAAEETGIQASLENLMVHGRAQQRFFKSEDSSWSLDEAKILYGEGSVVRLYELDSTTLDTIGHPFVGRFFHETGKFQFDSISLKSPYVLLELSSQRIDEGPEEEWWFDGFLLSGIVDLRETDDICLNLVTHLESYRLRHLVKSGLSFSEAKKRAGREILDAFGMNDVAFDFDKAEHFEDRDNKDVLDVISYLINANFSTDVDAVALKLGEDGSLQNIEEQSKELLIYRALGRLDGIEKLNAEDSSKVPVGQKKLLIDFATLILELGECTTKDEGVVKENAKVSFNFVCASEKWTTVAKKVDEALETWTDPRDGVTYKTVTYKINGKDQVWMAENLQYNSSNGLYTFSEALALDSSVVLYSVEECVANGHDEQICDTLRSEMNNINYQRLYSVIDSVEHANGSYQGACPAGWRLPKGDDWENLLSYVESSLNVEPYELASYLGIAGFGHVVELTEKGEVTSYYAILPDSSYTNPIATLMMFANNGKWFIDQSINSVGQNKKDLYVRCIKND